MFKIKCCLCNSCGGLKIPKNESHEFATIEKNGYD